VCISINNKLSSHISWRHSDPRAAVAPQTFGWIFFQHEEEMKIKEEEEKKKREEKEKERQRKIEKGLIAEDDPEEEDEEEEGCHYSTIIRCMSGVK